jgi:hypothetical protein
MARRSPKFSFGSWSKASGLQVWAGARFPNFGASDRKLEASQFNVKGSFGAGLRHCRQLVPLVLSEPARSKRLQVMNKAILVGPIALFFRGLVRFPGTAARTS